MRILMKINVLIERTAKQLWEEVILKIIKGLDPERLFPFLSKHFLYLIWILLVALLPVVGLIIWWFAGPKANYSS